MHNEFLRSVAKVFVENTNNKDEFPVFVFPNRRSMKFFTKYLGEEYGKKHNKPLLSPDMKTINDLFLDLSGKKTVDSIEALYILYCNYIKIKPNNVETFDEFISWGEVLLKDFDDIDKYYIDAKQLFHNVKDLKELDSDYSFLEPEQKEAISLFWSSYLKGEFTEKKEFFESIWVIMFELYNSFKNDLSDRGVGYEGMIYKDVIDKSKIENFSQKYVFIGLNTPNVCERKLFSILLNNGKADFYWDYYGSFLTDRHNSAGEMIRRYVEQYPSKYEINQPLFTLPNIKVIGIPSNVGQAFAVKEILDTISKGNITDAKAFETAVVLPSENLLMPLLYSIPKSFKSINVTMGYPIASTSFYSFMNMICSLQMEIKEKDGVVLFYHKWVNAILSHNYIKSLIGGVADKIRETILNGNLIFVKEGDEVLHNNEILNLIFKRIYDASQIPDYQIEILKSIEGVMDSLDKEFLYQYYLKINRLKSLNIPMEKRTYFKFLASITRKLSVPFRGEPLRGLQVMGSLEIRALDFDNIIYTSANEGVFPSANISPSLIPHNLRFGFGMPTYQMQDAIAAYHFYRSITRASNVYLIYDTRSEGLSTGEVSRYVKQLKYHYNAEIDEQIISTMCLTKPIGAINKNDDILAKLNEKFIISEKGGFSATLLNNYLSCPLKFYLENIEGVEEDEDINEEVDSKLFGTFYHNSMEAIYDKYKGEIISKEILGKEIKDKDSIERVITEQIKKELNIKQVLGNNIIIKELLKKYITITLNEDLRFAPFTYISAEDKFKSSLPIPNVNENVKFKAFIDRIDRLENGVYRIIDYKTGTVEKKNRDFSPSVLFNNKDKKPLKEIFQLYFYAYILSNDKKLKNINFNEDFSNLSLVIYPLRKLKTESVFEMYIGKEEMEEFSNCLSECIGEIFNEDIPFSPSYNKHVCMYCNFKALCGV